MRRRWRWYWAVPVSFVVAYAVLVGWQWLCMRGNLSDPNEAPLEPLYRGCLGIVLSIAPWAIRFFVDIWFDMPLFVAALVTYELLRRPARPGALRCLECGQILRGLSEPRCPGCGVRI